MTFMDVVRSIPIAREDLLQVAGLRARGHAGIGAAHLGAFGIGLAIGAGIALLYAPTAGSELRRQLASRIEGLSEEQEEDLARGETH